MSLLNDERRQFFRVDDEAEISFKVMSNDETDDWIDSRAKADHERKSQLENEILTTLAKLKGSQPELARLLSLINQKMNTLNFELHREDSHELTLIDEDPLSSINLSACGISFVSDKQVIEEQVLLLQMRLLPSNSKVTLLGKVIDTEPGPSHNKQIVRIAFEDIDSATQDLLIQHLFQVQVRERHSEDDH